MPLTDRVPMSGRAVTSRDRTEGPLEPGRPSAFVPRDGACRPARRGKRLLVFAQHVGQLFQGETKLIRVDERGDQRCFLARESVVQAGEESAQFTGDLFVVWAFHQRIVSDEAHSTAAAGTGAAMSAGGRR